MMLPESEQRPPLKVVRLRAPALGDIVVLRPRRVLSIGSGEHSLSTLPLLPTGDSSSALEARDPVSSI